MEKIELFLSPGHFNKYLGLEDVFLCECELKQCQNLLKKCTKIIGIFANVLI